MSTISNQSSPLQGGTRGACSFFRAPASSIVPYKDISLVDIYHYITGPYAAERTAKLRSLLKYGAPDATHKSCGGESEGLNRFNGSGGAGPRDLSAARAFKRTKFDYVTFSGTFTRRTDADLVAHSGYLCLDFDHLDQAEFTENSRVIDGNSRSAEASLRSKGACLTEVRRLLLSDPYFETLLLFVSPSGNGLKWVIPIDLEQCEHRTWFNAVRNYLAATYHLDADPACVNVSRSCFLPHDPDCYIAPRLLPELAPAIEANSAVEDLMVSLGATNIQISVNNQGDTIADKTSENNEQAE